MKRSLIALLAATSIVVAGCDSGRDCRDNNDHGCYRGDTWVPVIAPVPAPAGGGGGSRSGPVEEPAPVEEPVEPPVEEPVEPPVVVDDE
jgi:hypothetical protein